MDTGVNLSRRGFLGGRIARPTACRPPWALAEKDFLRACTRCNKCIEVCPTKIIASGDGGYPEVRFFQAGCTFCGLCREQCRDGALQLDRGTKAAPWLYQAVIGDQCLAQRNVECRICGEQCDAAAIRFSPRLGGPPIPEIDRQRCTGCGACVAPCPVGAVRVG